ncbi:MAG: hypothetical protein P8Z78_07425 [Gammaproteobacteria bacterium]
MATVMEDAGIKKSARWFLGAYQGLESRIKGVAMQEGSAVNLVSQCPEKHK